jgi:hypothetical protein
MSQRTDARNKAIVRRVNQELAPHEARRTGRAIRRYGSDAAAHQPTVAVAAPTIAAATTENPAPRLSAARQGENSSINKNEATSGRCGIMCTSFPKDAPCVAGGVTRLFGGCRRNFMPAKRKTRIYARLERSGAIPTADR